jgi:hypothetical protein
MRVIIKRVSPEAISNKEEYSWSGGQMWGAVGVLDLYNWRLEVNIEYGCEEEKID